MNASRWPSMSDAPQQAKLSYVYKDGRTGSVSDYFGRNLLILLVSPGCPVCRQVVSLAESARDRFSGCLLAVADQGSREVVHHQSQGDREGSIDLAFAPLPEIYLGLKIPRGVWIRYPSLVLLDRSGRVRVFSNDAKELLDPAWFESGVCRFIESNEAASWDADAR